MLDSRNPHSHIVIIIIIQKNRERERERERREGPRGRRLRELRRRRVVGPVGLKISDQQGKFQCRNNSIGDTLNGEKSQKAKPWDYKRD